MRIGDIVERVLTPGYRGIILKQEALWQVEPPQAQMQLYYKDIATLWKVFWFERPFGAEADKIEFVLEQELHSPFNNKDATKL